MSGKMFWSLKDIKRLLNFIEALNLTIPPDASDPHWKEIDKFTRKPAGCSIRAFRRLLHIYLEEYSKPKSDWLLLPQMRSLVPLPQPDDDEIATSPDVDEGETASVDDEIATGPYHNEIATSPNDKSGTGSSSSIFHMTSASECNQSFGSFPIQQPIDTDVMFLMQLLPDVKKLDHKAKSAFKMEMQSLLYKLKYEEDF